MNEIDVEIKRAENAREPRLEVLGIGVSVKNNVFICIYLYTNNVFICIYLYTNNVFIYIYFK